MGMSSLVGLPQVHRLLVGGLRVRVAASLARDKKENFAEHLRLGAIEFGERALLVTLLHCAPYGRSEPVLTSWGFKWETVKSICTGERDRSLLHRVGCCSVRVREHTGGAYDKRKG